MSVLEQIKNFENELNQKYLLFNENKVYKIVSSISNWDDIILINDLNENMKTSLKFFSTNIVNNKYEYFCQYSTEENLKNEQVALKSLYFDKINSSIESIMPL